MVNLEWFTLLVKFESWCWRKSNSVPKTTFFERKLSWIWLTVSKTRMSDFKKNDFDFRNISNNFLPMSMWTKTGPDFCKILIIGCWNQNALASSFLLELSKSRFYLGKVHSGLLKKTDPVRKGQIWPAQFYSIADLSTLKPGGDSMIWDFTGLPVRDYVGGP